MTDKELRDAAWEHLRQTTVGWSRVKTYPPSKLAGTHWGKAKVLLDQIGTSQQVVYPSTTRYPSETL